VVNVLLFGSAVQVKRHIPGGVIIIVKCRPERAVLDDGRDADLNTVMNNTTFGLSADNYLTE
jgi:hypothetical protein